jgi:hypothetical protein
VYHFRDPVRHYSGVHCRKDGPGAGH